MDKSGTLEQNAFSDRDTRGQLPLLSVVIPTHQRTEEFHALLSTLNRQTLQKNDVEILVVSNLPDPALEKICQQSEQTFPIQVLTVGSLGANGARNLGLSHARAKWVLLLDDDCLLPDENYFERVIHFHEKWPQVCAVGGAYLNPVHLTDAGRHYNWISNGWLQARFDGVFQTTRLVGGCVSYKNDILKTQGLTFDESIVYGGTETEFHLRLVEHGLELYFHPELSVLHNCQISEESLWKKAVAQGYGKAKRLSTREVVKEESLPTFWSVLLKDSKYYDLYREGFMGGEWLFGSSQNPFLKIFFPLLKRLTNQRRSWFVLWFVARGIHLIKSIARRIYFPIRESARWCYWRARDVMWFFTEIYWSVYHMFSEVRGQVSSFRGRWTGRLIRSYWTIYPLIHYVKNRRNSPAKLLELRIPLTYPNLETVFSPHWDWQCSSNISDAERKTKEGEAQRLGLNIEKPSSQTREWKVSKINSLSKKEILQLRQGGGPSAIHLVIDSLPSASKMLAWIGWLKSLKGKAHLSYELAYDKDEKTFDAYRWLHRFSVCTESLGKKWRARYTYRDQEGKVWKRNGVWFSEKWNQGPVPEVSVIVPHHEDFENLKVVLGHLEKQTFVRDRFEVVVIDNAVDKLLLSEQQRQEVLNRDLRISFHSIQSLQEGAYLAGTARNMGIANSRAEQILFLDSDILLPGDFIEKLSAQLQVSDVLMAKRWMLKDGVQEISENHLYREDDYWEGLKAAKAWTDLMDYWKYSCTYCFALSRKNLLAAGPFDPAFTMYGFEDVDLGFRLFKKGLRFSFASEPCYHLFPRKQGHNYHPESGKREKTLAESAFIFFSLRPERLPFIVTQGYFAPTFPVWIKRLLCFWRRA